MRLWQAPWGLALSKRVLYLCRMLEYALNNVGVAQFYGNSSGNDSAEAPGALLEIGARRIAQMVETSNCLFGRPLPKDRTEREDLLDALLPNEIAEKLAALDKQFYGSTENLLALNVAYVMAHKADFT